jgi:hypothetical protein
MREITEEEAMSALVALLRLRPGKPGSFNKKNEMYRPGDEKQPLFSEAWLYTAIGKEEARTVLCCLSTIAQKAGLDYDTIENQTWRDDEEQEKRWKEYLAKRKKDPKAKKMFPLPKSLFRRGSIFGGKRS